MMKPLNKNTIKHAISFLQEAATKPLAIKYPMAAFHQVVRNVKVPCRAIGAARETLRATGSIQMAIEHLKEKLDV